MHSFLLIYRDVEFEPIYIKYLIERTVFLASFITKIRVDKFSNRSLLSVKQRYMFKLL